MTIDGFRPLFDGRTLDGWRAVPRIYGTSYPGGPSALSFFDRLGVSRPAEPERHPAVWAVEDGAIVGRQSTPGSGYGGYLVSEASFGDFELVLEARPDWPADTGVIVRRRYDDWAGFQVLLDHREAGGIGGFFGNGVGGFHALPFAVRAVHDPEGRVIGIEADDPETSLEPVTPAKTAPLSHAVDVEEFLRIWRWDDWNELRIRCIGTLPVLTTWVNGLKVAELDTGNLEWPNYQAAEVSSLLGARGHIALEVHDNDPVLGDLRWGHGARCRWRAIRIREYS